MTLSDKQVIFTKNLVFLINWANSRVGTRVRIDGVSRTESQQLLNFKGYEVILDKGKLKLKKLTRKSSASPQSQHLKRLAADLILDKLEYGEWVYQTKTEAYKFLGEKWKSIHADNVWGGDWSKFPDGNHFEMRG